MKEKTKKFIIENKLGIITVIILILLLSIAVYFTFAFYTDSSTKNLINSSVGYFESPDLSISYMVEDRDSDGQGTGTYTAYWVAPSYNYEYNLSSSSCTNGATFSRYTDEIFSITSDSNTKCYFYYDAIDLDSGSDLQIILMREIDDTAEYTGDGYIAAYEYSLEGLYNLGLGFNSTESYCTTDEDSSYSSDISFNEETGELDVSSDGITLCYAYFDELNYKELTVYDAEYELGEELIAVIPTVDFDYTGDVQSTVITVSGYYQLEVWGAEGGYRSSDVYGGNGGYSYGTIYLEKGTTLYVYVGGSGASGGFNGGGIRSNDYAGGGGGTDFRIETDSLYSRVIVAGGGGSDGATSKTGMYGGGETGGSTTESYGTGGYGGTQTGNTWLTTTTSTSTTTSSAAYAGFGFGGNGIYASSGYGGAGGGGWYGGSGSVADSSSDDDRGGGGGSGYVYTIDTAVNYPDGCLLDSSYYMIDAETIAGNEIFLSPDGEEETGHTGDGYARLTFIGVL